MTAATQPRIEDILNGGIPWIPRAMLFIHFSPMKTGMISSTFSIPAEGKMGPFILVMEGSIPNEKNQDEGYWAAFGTDKNTGQPIATCECIDRLAPPAWAVITAGTCAAHGGIHAMEGNPTA
jgi:hydrogenase small subunit